MSRVHYTHCPVCGSAGLTNVLQAKDHTVSGELFWIVECQACSLRFTQDVPDEMSIAPYYRSESYISHTDTSKGLVNRLYHQVRKRTLAHKRKLIEKITGLTGGKLLDVGSGTGSFLHEMKTHGWDTAGLEPDEGARKMAKERYQLELAGISHLSQLTAGRFDVITLWHVLEHIHQLAATIQQLKAVLKDTGKLVIAVPNYTAADAGIYKAYWAAYDVPRHLYHFSPQSMKVLMEQNGLKIADYKPMWFDSFYIAMLSSKYKNGRINWLAACWNGWRSNLRAIGNAKKYSSVIYVITK